jgi:predicted phage terminase large subunit-like protein
MAQALDPRTVQTPALELIDQALVNLTERRGKKRLACFLPPQEGKPLALDTPIRTPGGWSTMGALKVGDKVVDRYGDPCRVTWVSPTWRGRPCYEVRSHRHRSAVVADAAHEWPVGPAVEPSPLATTAELASGADLVGPEGEVHRVLAEPVDSVPVRCIAVDSPTHTYLAGRALLPTHNSERISHWYPLWLLERDRSLRVAVVSYSDSIAMRWGWQLRLDIQTFDGEGHDIDLGLRLHDRPAQGSWRLRGETGGLVCVGVAGSLTGRPVDCLRAGTQVLTDGGYVPIEELDRRGVGTRVPSYSHSARRVEWRQVEATRAVPDRPLVEIVTAQGRRIACTPDHRVYGVDSGYRPAYQLQPGDRLVCADDSAAAGYDEVVAVQRLDERATVYDLQVEGNRNFFADGVLVHNCLIIDDPIKDLEQARSPKYRERAWRFWQAVAVPRMGPNTTVVLVQTRWDEDDLAGRLLATEADKWHIISIPARCEDPATDPLGRDEGEYMISARGRTVEDWKEREREVGAYVFAALFQQRPAPAEGGLFRRIWWRYFTWAGENRLHLADRIADLRDCWKFATVDLAASERTSADWTVISAWARTLAGDLVLLDRQRVRVGEDQHFAHARPLVERWQLDTVFVEKSQHGFSLVKEATQNGVPITPLDAEQDKFTRALPASAWCSGGRVWLPANAMWLDEWITEFSTFPASKNDDQVDTLSYAVRAAITQWVPLVNRAQQATVQRQDPEPDPFGGAPVTDFDRDF